MNRGELVTATVDLAEGASVATLRELLAQRYDEEPFVHLLPEGVAPATRMVRGSNHAVVNVFADRNPRRALVTAAIDHLVKGPSGQAVQNINLRMVLGATLAMEADPLFPSGLHYTARHRSQERP